MLSGLLQRTKLVLINGQRQTIIQDIEERRNYNCMVTVK